MKRIIHRTLLAPRRVIKTLNVYYVQLMGETRNDQTIINVISTSL